MADEKEPEKETSKSDGDSSWDKMTGLVRNVFNEEFDKREAAWQASRSSESQGNPESTKTEKESPLKTERKKGFLEKFFEGLE